jgi:predicted ATPase
MVATYTDWGYNLIELPVTSVEERVRFVVDAVTAFPR